MLMNHQPVLLKETLDAFPSAPNSIYIDGTFGQGGHSQALLKKLDQASYLFAMDRDPAAATYAEKISQKDKRFQFCRASFTHLKDYAIQYGIYGKVTGILLDLGVSSTQLDSAERGFSFLKEGPLDMRMDPTQGISAAKWIASVSVNEMADIFFHYGEERYSKRIAIAIDKERRLKPIQTTLHLANVIKAAHPHWPRRIHPATRVFQAIRIHLNQELSALKDCLTQSIEVLKPGGRLAIITFHSLEAREIKQFVREMSQSKATTFSIQWVNTRIKPSLEEIAINARARSAILRVIEKIN